MFKHTTLAKLFGFAAPALVIALLTIGMGERATAQNNLPQGAPCSLPPSANNCQSMICRNVQGKGAICVCLPQDQQCSNDVNCCGGLCDVDNTGRKVCQ
jgi:hypothetical protein